MAISPVNIVRISNNMQSNILLDSLRRNTLSLFLEENRLATGNRFNTLSEDPVGSARAMSLTEILEQQGQVLSNIQFADSFLSATDTAVGEIHDLLTQAKTLASEAANSTFSQDQRDSSAELVLGLLNQLVNVGNRKLGDMFLFGGQRTTTLPFTQFTGGVEYNGDTNDLTSHVDLSHDAAMNMSGAELFGSLAAQITGFVDLDPALTTDTRLADMAGTTGRGIQKGIVRITTDSPPSSFLVDLRGAETAGDVVDALNAGAAAAGLTTGVGGQFNAAIHTNGGFSLSVAAGSVTVADTSEGTVARDLGFLGTAAGVLNGSDVGTRVTADTLITALFGGVGASLGSIKIVNGARSATLDLSSATTVQDILNRINSADLGVQARINAAGTSIDITNLTSGNQLSVTEAGGNTAELLGIRSFYGGTPLSSLNNGRGVGTRPGQNDLHIVSADGTAFDVSLTGASTVQDVLDRINAAAVLAGAAVTASLPANANGIQLNDTSGGAGTLRVERADFSTAIDDLGLSNATAASGTTLVGADVGVREADSMFSALLKLHDALVSGDTGEITAAGERIEDFITTTARLHGVVGARSKAMSTRLQYTEAAVDASKALLSEVKDVDYSEAITRFQLAQTTLQATLMSGSRMMQLSLMNFISSA